MQSDPCRCYSILYLSWLNKKMQEGPDQTAHPCNLSMTRETNKIVPHRKRSFAFRVFFSLKMSFKILMISIYVVCRQVASYGHFTCDSLQNYSLYIWSIASIRLSHLVISREGMIFSL